MYFWKQTAGPRVGLQNSSGPSPEFPVSAPADYIFELRVADLIQGVGDTSNVAVTRVRVTDRNRRVTEAGLAELGRGL